MYNYETEKAELFTDDGQRQFLKIRDNVQRLVKEAGVVRMQEAIAGATGSSWTNIACIDRMVEIGELQELKRPNCPGQYRIFTAV